MWKRIGSLWLCCLLLFLFAGCREEEEQELLPIAKEDFMYSVATEIDAMTVDEDGLLYTIRWGRLDPEEELGGNIVEVYDTDGNRIKQQKLTESGGSVFLSFIEDGILYYVAMEYPDYYVYALDLDTWEEKRLAKLPGYQWFEQMVKIGDMLYVLGETGESKSFSLYPGVMAASNHGEQICRVNLADAEAKPEVMKIEFPLGMYKTSENTLMIYHYAEDSGFGFLEFDPEEMKLAEHSWTHVVRARDSIRSCGDGFLYQDGEYLYYGTSDGVQVQLISDEVRALWPGRSPVCQKGFVFLYDTIHPGEVKRICIADLIKDNKEIRVLTEDAPNKYPFGCGYQMTTQPAASEEFALKVLAQDSDFDLYLLDTKNDCAFNLKENGAFYALNKVKGVQEYLDACFPYIKELAYNEDGDIWMIPVEVEIPGIVYHREFCKTQGVDYTSMNLMEFMEFIEQTATTEPEKMDISFNNILEPMLMQYMSRYDTLDTELFRNHLSKLKQIMDNADVTGLGSRSIYGQSLGGGEAEEFYLSLTYSADRHEDIIKQDKACKAYATVALPKLEEGIGNVGTIVLLAVNPESDNLKETLNYITEYCNYRMTVQNSFLLEDTSTYTMEDAYIKDLYDMVAGGEITFRMPYELYSSLFWEYLYGEISLEDAIAEAERRLTIYQGE